MLPTVGLRFGRSRTSTTAQPILELDIYFFAMLPDTVRVMERL